MDNKMRSIYRHRLGKGFGLKFCMGYVDQQILEAWRAHQMKCSDNNNKDRYVGLTGNNVNTVSRHKKQN